MKQLSACATIERPWHGAYGNRDLHVPDGPDDMLCIYQHAAAAAPQATALHYFDSHLSYAWVESHSNALAVWLDEEAGVRHGDRVAIALQNTPLFVVAVIAAWKLGAVPMPINPGYRSREFAKLFADGTPRAVVCSADSYDVVSEACSLCSPDRPQVLAASAWDYQSRDDLRVLPPRERESNCALTAEFAIASRFGQRPPTIRVGAETPALLLYTSGTTGEPKGAVLTHRALATNARTAPEWFGIRENGRILAVAPLFHITGFELHLCSALLTRSTLVMCYRFEPRVVLDAVRERRPTFMIAAITAYIALMNLPDINAADLSCFDALFSGGAPVPPAVVKSFRDRFARRIATAYGMTETAAQTHVAPYELDTPVDPESGALSVGLPISGVDAIVMREDGTQADPGESGEILVRGPMLMAGYWKKPESSAEALAGGWMHTGDVGFMDATGWFYVVDRKKDLIIASGFKVWPREVEEVLYRHSAVREVAVVGSPDPYRGETVHAFVSLGPGAHAGPEELVRHCRELLVGYKVPRVIDVLPELPKTLSGKIMRSELRNRARAPSNQPAL